MDTLTQPFAVEGEVDLAAIGYDEGSVAEGIVNPTRAWREAWDARVVAADDSDRLEEARQAVREAEAGTQARRQAEKRLSRLQEDVEQAARDASKELIPYVVNRVVLCRGENELTVEIAGPDDVAKIDDIDPRIFNLVIYELLEQGDAGVHNARRSFRRKRLSELVDAGEVSDADGRPEAAAPAATE